MAEALMIIAFAKAREKKVHAEFIKPQKRFLAKSLQFLNLLITPSIFTFYKASKFLCL